MLTTLAPLVGAEEASGHRAVSEGWAKGANKDKISDWSSKGVALVEEELEILFQREYEAEYNEKMRRVCPTLRFVNLRDSYAHHLSDLGFGVPRIMITRS